MSLRSAIEWLFDPYLQVAGATWNRWVGCTRESTACTNCLDPNTRVLYADMTWRPIGEVQVGDSLVAFTETPTVGGNRLIELASVQAVRRVHAPTVELSVDDRTVIASEDHRWLTGQQRPTWKSTVELALNLPLRTLGASAFSPDLHDDAYRAGYIAGATAGDGTMRWQPEWRSASLGYPQCYWRVAVLADDRAILDRLVEYLAGHGIDVQVKPFNGGPTSRRPMLKVETRKRDHLALITELIVEQGSVQWRAGWLAGIFDTDGSYSGNTKHTNLRICQRKANGVLEACERYAADLGFVLKPEKHAGCPTARLRGDANDQLSFLTSICPALVRKCRAFYGRRLGRRSTAVIGIKRGPARELVDIQTTTGTFIAEGLATHNCYIARQPPLRMRHLRFDKVAVGGRTEIVMMPERALYKPLSYRTPLLIFPNSLADLWHPAVPVSRTAEMFAVMLLAGRHIFQTTTKRHRRQRNWLRSGRFHVLVAAALERIVADSPVRIGAAAIEAAREHLAATASGAAMKPLPNVWLGVTCEANENGERLRYLQQTPAALRWVSCEPITDGGLELTRHLPPTSDGIALPRLDWVVFGGESGPSAKATALDTAPAPGLRPLDLEHLRDLIGQARELGAAVFVKQLGEPWARQSGAVSRAGRDPAEWPLDLQVREYPAALAVRALQVDPDNARAQAALAGAASVGAGRG